jgi:hypothetical protein
MLHDEDFTIVEKYGAEYRGIIQYYLLAQDVSRLNSLYWVMETSMLKTLAAKHTSTVSAMARKYKRSSIHPTDPGPASRQPCPGRTSGYWSPASEGSRCDANAPPTWPTGNRSWPPGITS